MLYEFLRLFKYNGSTFTDLSIVNQDETVTDTDISLTTTDYIYMAEYFPFNNFFYYMNTANTDTDAALSIEYWNGSEWQSAVDILDGTETGGASLARSGVIQFSTDLDYPWVRIGDTSNSADSPTELQALTIYNMYWLRFSYDTNLAGSPDFKRISYAFTTSQQLNNIDVEINDYWPAFAAAKADWIPEILTASKLLVMDLRRDGLVVGRGKILRFDDVSLACDYRTLHLIYSNLGKGHVEKRDEAWKAYKSLINIKKFSLDEDEDGYLDEREIGGPIRGKLHR